MFHWGSYQRQFCRIPEWSRSALVRFGDLRNGHQFRVELRSEHGHHLAALPATVISTRSDLVGSKKEFRQTRVAYGAASHKSVVPFLEIQSRCMLRPSDQESSILDLDGYSVAERFNPAQSKTRSRGTRRDPGNQGPKVYAHTRAIPRAAYIRFRACRLRVVPCCAVCKEPYRSSCLEW